MSTLCPVRAAPFSAPALAIIKLIEAVAPLFGLDVFIQRENPRWGFFNIEYERHAWGCREIWGFGLHVMVSRDSREARIARSAMR